MPLTPGAPVSTTIPELHSGDTYAHTLAKFGKKRANKQAIAIALSNARETKGRAMGGPTMMAPQAGIASNMMANPMMAQQQNGIVPSGTITPNGSAMPTASAMVGAPNVQAQNASSMTTPPTIGMNPATNAAAGVVPTPSATMGAPQQNNAGAPVSAGIGGTMSPAPSMPPYLMGAPHKKGGKVEGRAFGGFSPVIKPPSMNAQFQERQEARGMTRGPILSAVPGRTDAHFTHVPSGSYVIPADIVSGRGQGNTLAGANTLQHLFKMGPYGTSMPKMGGGSSIPKPPSLGKMTMASGGGKNGDHVGMPVKVKLAGGEIVVPPENLMEVVHPNLKHAHAIMDAWVKHERKKLVKTLVKLPGPARD